MLLGNDTQLPPSLMRANLAPDEVCSGKNIVRHLRFASQAWIPSLLVNDGTPEPTCTKTGN